MSVSNGNRIFISWWKIHLRFYPWKIHIDFGNLSSILFVNQYVIKWSVLHRTYILYLQLSYSVKPETPLELNEKHFYGRVLSSTITSVQHPLEWCGGCHRTTARVRSPHTSYRWREERVIETIKWMGIIRRPWLTRTSGGNLARTPGLHPYYLREVQWDFWWPQRVRTSV